VEATVPAKEFDDMQELTPANGPGKHRFLQLRVLDRTRPFSPVVIRAFLATFLIYMTQDNVFSADRMQEFVGFLTTEGFPAAEVLAPISVYAQFTCGVLVALGLLTRWAAAVMIVNFVVAIGGVHIGTPFRAFLEPLAMLSASLFLLLHGPGRLALDNRFGRLDDNSTADV
jgi:putative oxidoreductase